MDVTPEALVDRLQILLKLTHWRINLFHGWGGGTSEEWAEVVFDQCEREATIRLRGDIPSNQLSAVIAHEMVHILMTDLEFIGCNGRSTDIMDLFNRELERVVDTIANALVAEG